jgi:excisionase family DNA binding protein
MRTYTVEQVAELLQVTIGTVRALARTGRLHGKKVGRHWRFTDAHLAEFLGITPTEQAAPTEQAIAAGQAASDPLAAYRARRGKTP